MANCEVFRWNFLLSTNPKIGWSGGGTQIKEVVGTVL